MDEDYKRFCLKCGWNDPDYGCTSELDEAVWQCPMYRHYHPEEVKRFDGYVEELEKFMKDQEINDFLAYLKN